MIFRSMTALAAFFIVATAWAQPAPQNLPGKFQRETEKLAGETCTSQNASCTGWCDKNNPTSTTCKQECDWRVSYCKETGLYPQQSRKSVWVGKRD